MPKDPGWYAIILSLFSIIASIIAIKISKRAARLSVSDRLAVRSLEMNDAFLRHKVKGPYAHLLKIPDRHVQKFTAKAVLLFQHLNLLREIFENRDILEKKVVASYRRWATTIVRPWIEADEDLSKTWQMTMESKDFYAEGFIDWLQELFQIRKQ